MATILIRPEHLTKPALSFMVARAVIDDGNTVTISLAGEVVPLMRKGVLDNPIGLGTGSLRKHHCAVTATGTRINLSELSSRSRGLDLQTVE